MKGWPSARTLTSRMTCSGWVGSKGELRSGIGGGAAGVDGILEALDGAGGVEPVAEAVGDGLVGLLDVGEHLGVERGLEVGGGGHDCGGVGVLGFEVGDDFGRVLVAHPAVVVVEGDAVERGGRGVAAGDGRLGGRLGGLRRCGRGRWGGHSGEVLLRCG